MTAAAVPRSHPGISIPAPDIHPSPGHPSQPSTSVPARHPRVRLPPAGSATAPGLCIAAVGCHLASEPAPAALGNQGTKPQREALRHLSDTSPSGFYSQTSLAHTHIRQPPDKRARGDAATSSSCCRGFSRPAVTSWSRDRPFSPFREPSGITALHFRTVLKPVPACIDPIREPCLHPGLYPRTAGSGALGFPAGNGILGAGSSITDTVTLIPLFPSVLPSHSHLYFTCPNHTVLLSPALE